MLEKKIKAQWYWNDLLIFSLFENYLEWIFLRDPSYFWDLETIIAAFTWFILFEPDHSGFCNLDGEAYIIREFSF